MKAVYQERERLEALARRLQSLSSGSSQELVRMKEQQQQLREELEQKEAQHGEWPRPAWDHDTPATCAEESTHTPQRSCCYFPGNKMVVTRATSRVFLKLLGQAVIYVGILCCGKANTSIAALLKSRMKIWFMQTYTSSL